MKKILAILITVISFMLFFSSCSDDSTNTPTNESGGNTYFPTKIDNNWTYSFYFLDSNGNKNPSTEISYKKVITDSAEYHGKGAFTFQPQDLLGNKIDDNEYYYTTSSKIYRFYKLFPIKFDFSLPIDIPEDWYLIMDTKNNSWVIYRDTLENISFTYNNMPLTLDGILIIKGIRGSTENINYGTNMDQIANCTKFTLEYDFQGMVSSAFPFDFQIYAYNWYSKNIGLVKKRVDPFTIIIENLPIVGTQTLMDYTGNEEILLDFTIITGDM